jgi:hypothetical protein
MLEISTTLSFFKKFENKKEEGGMTQFFYFNVFEFPSFWICYGVNYFSFEQELKFLETRQGQLEFTFI